jgi:hypothetical protein
MWWAQLRKGQTYVYFIQGDPETPIKVGFTNRVGKRLGELQTGSYQRLRVLAVLPAPRSVETAYHRLLQSERGIGEWFSGPLTDQLMFRVLEIADRMVASYDGSGQTPDIYDFDDSIERPSPVPVADEPIPELEVVPGRSPGNRVGRVSGDFFGRGMRRGWRVSSGVEHPVTRRFVDPASLRDKAA